MTVKCYFLCSDNREHRIKLTLRHKDERLLCNIINHPNLVRKVLQSKIKKLQVLEVVDVIPV